MVKTITLCSSCNSKIDVEGEPNQEIEKKCPNCDNNVKILLNDEDLEELELYPIFHILGAIIIINVLIKSKGYDYIPKYILFIGFGTKHRLLD